MRRLIFALLIPTLAQAGVDRKTDAEELKVFGKVREMRIEVFDCFTTYKPSGTNFVRAETTNISTNLYRFNKEGMLVDKTYFISRGNNKVREILDYADGMHLTNREYIIDDKPGNRYAFVWSNDYQFREEFKATGQGPLSKTSEALYDAAGKIVEFRNVYRDEVSGFTRYTYERDKLAKYENFKGRAVASFSDYQYNEAGLLKRRTFSEGALAGKYPVDEYAYDEAGNLTQHKKYSGLNKLSFIENNTYSNNLVVRRDFVEEQGLDLTFEFQYGADKNVSLLIAYNRELDLAKPWQIKKYSYSFYP